MATVAENPRSRIRGKQKKTKRGKKKTHFAENIMLVIYTNRAYIDVSELNTLTIIKNINR